MLYGSPFPENLNGTDFSPKLPAADEASLPDLPARGKAGHCRTRGTASVRTCARGTRSLDVTTAISTPARFPKSPISFAAPGADVLLVAMGNPKQELFIQDHLAATGCRPRHRRRSALRLLAGEVPRATPWVQRWRLEWVYRLAQEPRRLAGRYLVGIPLFLMRILRQWWSGSRVADLRPALAASDRAGLPAAIPTNDRGIPRKRRSPPNRRH